MEKIKFNNRQKLQDLAKQVADLSSTEKNAQRLQLWKDHNSLKKTRPPVYLRLNCWDEIIPESEYIFKDGLLHDIEYKLRTALFLADLEFDYVVDSYLTVPAVLEGVSSDYFWGVCTAEVQSESKGGAWGFAPPPLREYDDISKLKQPKYLINLEKTNEQLYEIRELFGGIIDVRLWAGGNLGLSAPLGVHAAKLRGVQNLMMDVIDNPEWVHELMKFMSDSIVKYIQDIEKLGLVTSNHEQWPLYIDPIQPDFSPEHIRLKDCWGWGESQEFDLFSPDMFDEFLLQYQIPILSLAGLIDPANNQLAFFLTG